MLLERYNPDWVQHFAALKGAIEKALPGPHYRMEHVGSTAVPFLDAKPIIDIDIIYQDATDLEKIKPALENIGYEHRGNQGIPDREVFKRSGKQTHGLLDRIRHHLYVCPVHSKALERHILFRDFLRKQDWARAVYQEMKYVLAEKAQQDQKIYAELKELTVNGFIDWVIAAERNKG